MPTLAVAAPAALTVRIDRPHLRLGTDPSAELVIESPIDLAVAPSLTASVGTVEALAPAGPRRWTARYVPPKPTYPQVALISAIGRPARSTDPGPAVGWASLPLWGQGEALVRARRGASITVRIGERTFGPVVANARGIALVPIVVPPGIPTGYHGRQPVDLGLPPIPHVHLVLGAARVRGDVAREVPLYLFAVDEDGKPRKNARLLVAVERGTVSALREESPGFFEARWSVPAGDPGEVAISSWLAEEPRERVSERLTVDAGPPARFELEAASAQVTAGEGPIAITVRAFDQRGQPTRAELDVSSSLGTLAPEPASAPGRYRYSLVVPPAFGGATRVAIDVRTVETVASGRLELPLVAGRPARFVLASGALEAIADGVSASVLTFKATDPWGNVVPVEAPEARVDLGVLAGPKSVPGGGFELRYRAPALEAAAEATLELSAAGIRFGAPIALRPPSSALHLVARAGVLTNAADVFAPSVSVELLATPAVLGHSIGVGLELGGLTFAPPASAGVASLRGRHQYVDLLASVSWLKSLGGRLGARVGALGGVSRVDSALTLEGQPELAEGTFVAAFGLAGALSLEVGPGTAFLELRGTFHGDPALDNLRGALFGGQLLVGYAFGVP